MMTTARARGGDLGKVSTFKKSHFMADSADFDAAPPFVNVPPLGAVEANYT
jgi:hypothetical protein